MNDLIKLVKKFADGRQAVAVRAAVEVNPADLAEALELPTPTPTLLLSGGAGGMSEEEFERLSTLFASMGEVLAGEDVTVIDGGTDSGVMALMGRALADAGRTAPHVGVLPAHAEGWPGGPRGEEMLDPHHSHFVLLESDEWGAESELLCELTNYLAAGAPSLVVLVNGGEIAIKDLGYHVQYRREIVVFAGSGRLADEIARQARGGGSLDRLIAGLKALLRGRFSPWQERQRRIEALARYDQLTLYDMSASSDDLVSLLRHRFAENNGKE
jgi:hypothetical protein